MMTTEQTATDVGSETPEVLRPFLRRADIVGFGRVWGWPAHLARTALFAGTLLVCLFLLPWALYTFWVLFETAAELGVGPGGAQAPLWWREWPWRAALVFSVLAASGLAYLIQDHIALLGSERAGRILEEKAGRMLGPLPEARFFVHLRPEDRATRRAFTSEVGGGEDIGWLIPFADRLEFVGDRWRITLPRPVVTGVRRGPDFTRAGLGGAALDLLFRASDGAARRLRLQSRDGERLSETSARELGDALDAWLAAG